jgi:two-component system response regulator GlrR
LPQVAPAQVQPSERASKTSAHALSILVVDDEPFVRDTLVEMLLALGHRVTSAEGGRAAIDALSKASFDLVFTDLSMPEMDGWEVAREIRRRWPRLRVVVVTGHGTETLEPLAERQLVDAIIAKPFNFEQVEDTIAETQVGRMKAEG